MNRVFAAGMIGLFMAAGCSSARLHADKELRYCIAQASGTLAAIPSGPDNIPRSIGAKQNQWHYVGYRDWTSGFWPGILWYAYEYSRDSSWKASAQQFSAALEPLAYSRASDHDLGFQVYGSFGNGFWLTGDTAYKRILLATADTLSTLFRPKTGTLLSWPAQVAHLGGHNTIIDNMMNLELLFWAAKHGGGSRLYDIALQHAQTTMKNHFRPDYSAYHVVVYDTLMGRPIKKITHQGYADWSMWARGQSWAIYGFTMVYRETRDTAFRNFAEKLAAVYLDKLPADMIPYWDFNAPGIPAAPRDASAAAITASALLELSQYVTDRAIAKRYRHSALRMLAALSSAAYQSRNTNNAFLLHSTGHQPANGEVDASLIYADYYYMEALLRAKALASGKWWYKE